MSKEMVTVEFDKYLELLELKKEIENNKIVFNDYDYNSYKKIRQIIYTKDDAVSKLANELKESNKMCSKLNYTIESLEHDKIVYSEDMEYKISIIRKFSIWEFLKFRRDKLKI